MLSGAANNIPVHLGRARTLVMGVINVTPDSFSGDGIAGGIDGIAGRAKQMVEEGADIIDVGGESTRPGFSRVPVEEELRRVVPAVEAIRAEVRVPISVDTTKICVAETALRAGASMVNDVSGSHNAAMIDVVAHAGAALVIVHNGTHHSRTDLVGHIIDDLSLGVELARSAGIAMDSILVDPGLGLGKNWLDNFEIMRGLADFQSMGPSVLVGPSRKGMIERVLGTGPIDRLEGTVALVALCVARGADVIRVHDVRHMARVARMIDALVSDAECE